MVCVRSWNLGPAHIISLSTEVYFYLEFGLELLFRQYEWLRKDLEVNDSIERRPLSISTLDFPYFPLSCSKTRHATNARIFKNPPEP